MKKIEIVTIDVLRREWVDKVNGNLYQSAEIAINYGNIDNSACVVFTLPMALGKVQDYTIIKSIRQVTGDSLPVDYLWQCREIGILVRDYSNVKTTKKDCKAFGNRALIE